MSSQVKKNTINPKGSLYHHSLIKLLIVDQLKEQNQSGDTFVFKVLNPHLNIQKCPRHLHTHDSSQSPSMEKKAPMLFISMKTHWRRFRPLSPPLLSLLSLYPYHDLTPETRRKTFSSPWFSLASRPQYNPIFILVI